MLKYFRNFLVAILSLGVFSIAHSAPININSADAATLAQTISGIGPSKAQAIIDYRQENGPFASLDDLVKVQGIGFKTLDRIREFVIVAPETQKTSKSAAVGSSATESSASSKQPVLLPN